MNRKGLGDLLRGRRELGRPAFIPYLTAGDPSLAWTGRFVRELSAAGADAVELGVPFSDPIADGPVIQRASERALRSKTTLAGVLGLVASLRTGRDRRNGAAGGGAEGLLGSRRPRRDTRAVGDAIPVILFTYYNPVLRMGLERFARRARAAGVAGVLVVDLPPEEAADYVKVTRRAGLETVFLASPTTEPRRLKLIDAASTGFVYYVSRLGVTGERRSLSKTLAAELARLRRRVRKPVAVGFGISTPEQAREAARFGDAVVVGSALVKFAGDRRPAEAARRMRVLASAMVHAMRGRGRR